MSFLSYEHNCLIYNAILKNAISVDDQDVLLLQKLRSATDTNIIIDYYNRSAELVPKINKIYKTDNLVWDRCYHQYVKDIVTSLKNRNNNEALEKISKMLDSLESDL